jgi:hypothetical protein
MHGKTTIKKIPYYIISIYHYPRHTATNCCGKTVTLCQGLWDFGCMFMVLGLNTRDFASPYFVEPCLKNGLEVPLQFLKRIKEVKFKLVE